MIRPDAQDSPLELLPTLVEKIWGGARLGGPGGLPIGEAWMYVPEGAAASRVLSKGRPGAALPEVVPDRPQLIVKLLDTGAELSLQVHDQKWEGWLVLAAEPGAIVYSGLQPDVTSSALAAALAGDDAVALRSLLRPIELVQGDFLANPPGTVHALGAGLLVLEVQTPEDETLRLHDWNRTGPDGSRRPLQVEQALATLDTKLRPAPSRQALQSGSFAVERLGLVLEAPSGSLDRVRLRAPGWILEITSGQTPRAVLEFLERAH